MKSIILIASILLTFNIVYAQDLSNVKNDLESELQKWDKKWAFDSYIKGSVHIVESYSAWAKGCFLVTNAILADSDKIEGFYSNGYFYVKRFGSQVKATFESFIFYEGNEKIIRICYKDNMEKRCNH
jgi:hypothetical protein